MSSARGSRKRTAKDSTNENGASEPKKLMNSVESDLEFKDIKEKYNFKIVTFNVAGLRASIKKNCIEYLLKEDADIICLNVNIKKIKLNLKLTLKSLQELKCTEKEIPSEAKLDGYHAYWNVDKGLPGVGLLSKEKPIKVDYDLPDQFKNEKRLITAEFDKFILVSTYVVNSGRGLKTLNKRLEWNKIFDDHVKKLDKKKPVIIAGDMNVAHEEIDLKNPKTNTKNAGFTPEEREGMTTLLSYGFVDSFRHFYPDQKEAYTFWSYMGNARAKNVGWRLDYFIVSERFMMKHVKDNVIRSSIKGSDHCPIVLYLDL